MESYVNKIINSARIAENLDKQLKIELGIDDSMGISIGDPKQYEWIEKSKDNGKELETFLKSLDLGTLNILQTLMYYGRDEGSYKEMYDYFLSRKEDEEEIIRTIMGKSYDSISYYYSKAKDKLQEEGIDINNL